MTIHSSNTNAGNQTKNAGNQTKNFNFTKKLEFISKKEFKIYHFIISIFVYLVTSQQV